MRASGSLTGKGGAHDEKRADNLSARFAFILGATESLRATPARQTEHRKQPRAHQRYR
jgi:hypothetical protein